MGDEFCNGCSSVKGLSSPSCGGLVHCGGVRRHKWLATFLRAFAVPQEEAVILQIHFIMVDIHVLLPLCKSQPTSQLVIGDAAHQHQQCQQIGPKFTGHSQLVLISAWCVSQD